MTSTQRGFGDQMKDNDKLLKQKYKVPITTTRTGRAIKRPARFLDDSPQASTSQANASNAKPSQQPTLSLESPQPVLGSPDTNSLPLSSPERSPLPVQHVSDDEGSQSDTGDSETNFKTGSENLYDKQKPLFENNLFKVFVQKTKFQRQKKFRLEDHHYVIKVDGKKSQTMPLLKDIVLILDQSLLKVIKDLQSFYDKSHSHIIYITFHQPGMVSAVRSEGMNLWESPAKIISHVMNSFNLFSNSQDSLRLNNGFQVFIKVLSHDNVIKGSKRRKTPLKLTLGCTSTFQEAKACIDGILLIEPQFEKKFPNCCLLTSFILAYKHVNEGVIKLYQDFQCLWSSQDHSLNQIAQAENLIKSNIRELQLQLDLPEFGPYCTSNFEKLAKMYDVQINLIKNCQERYLSLDTYPFEFDSSKKQLFFAQISPGHVVPIILLKDYFRKNKKQICLLCKKSFHFNYKHSCTFKNKQCQLCFCPLAHKETIKCPHNFVYCYSQLENNTNKLCLRCNQYFFSSNCYTNHLNLACKRKRSKCVSCKKTIYASSQHYCNEGKNTLFCSTCKVFYDETSLHHCPLKQQNPTEYWPKLVFFDFVFSNPFSENAQALSCSVLSETDNGRFQSVVFLNDTKPFIGEHYIFDYDVDSKKPLRQQTKNVILTQESKLMLQFLHCKQSKTCIDLFLEFLFLPENKDAVFLSLNENSQNMSLILKMLTEANLIPTLVKKNNAFILIKLKCQNITFLNVSNYFNNSKIEIANQFLFPEDLLFFPLYLSDFTDKPTYSDFTHWLDSSEILETKKKYYDKVILSWNFNQELVKYSVQQTKIIAFACLNFLLETFYFQKKTFILINEPSNLYIFPFLANTPTLASYSYALLKYFYLNKEQLVSSPRENICQKNNASRGELEFVLFMESKYPEKKFIHFLSRPTGQKKFKQFAVDLFSPVTLEIFQYCGCFHHCHIPPNCKNPSRQHLTIDNINESFHYRSYEQNIFERNKFETFLQENCKGEYSNIIYVYECEWSIFKKQKEYLDFLSTQGSKLNRPLSRLTPRIAQRGGLTETYQFSWSQETRPNFKLSFLDVNSMYPYCGLKFDFPVGYPKIIIGNTLENVTIEQNQVCYEKCPLTFGLIHCEVLAPQDLQWPFLQFRTKDSVFLGLCKSCCIEQKVFCRHKKNSVRSFTSTWTLIEINKALELGYQILSIFEILYFTKSKPIFRNFLSSLSSLRLLNSYDNSDKEKFCHTINSDLNLYGTVFEVQTSDLCSNPMKKNFYKLMLNSVLGKLSSLNQYETTDIVQSQGQLEFLLTKHNLTEINVIDENHVMVSYVNDFVKSKNNFNIYLGSYVTAYAKIVLYDFMLKLRSLNYPLFAIDTDCLLFEQPKSCNSCPFVISLTPGNLKPVLDNCEILNYCSLGNRNYSIVYKDSKGFIKTQIKCKGLSLLSANLNDSLNYSVYVEFLNEYLKKELKSIQLKQIKYQTQTNLSKLEKETYFTFHNTLFIKRIVNSNGNSTPFGYVSKK